MPQTSREDDHEIEMVRTAFSLREQAGHVGTVDVDGDVLAIRGRAPDLGHVGRGIRRLPHRNEDALSSLDESGSRRIGRQVGFERHARGSCLAIRVYPPFARSFVASATLSASQSAPSRPAGGRALGDRLQEARNPGPACWRRSTRSSSRRARSPRSRRARRWGRRSRSRSGQARARARRWLRSAEARGDRRSGATRRNGDRRCLADLRLGPGRTSREEQREEQTSDERAEHARHDSPNRRRHEALRRPSWRHGGQEELNQRRRGAPRPSRNRTQGRGGRKGAENGVLLPAPLFPWRPCGPPRVVVDPEWSLLP